MGDEWLSNLLVIAVEKRLLQNLNEAIDKFGNMISRTYPVIA